MLLRMTGPRSFTMHLCEEQARLFAPLVASLFDALELSDGGVNLTCELTASTRYRWDAGRGITATLGQRACAPDPYAGGPIRVRELRLEREGGRALVILEELAWVGHELRFHAQGLGKDGETLERVVRAWQEAGATKTE